MSAPYDHDEAFRLDSPLSSEDFDASFGKWELDDIHSTASDSQDMHTGSTVASAAEETQHVAEAVAEPIVMSAEVSEEEPEAAKPVQELLSAEELERRIELFFPGSRRKRQQAEMEMQAGAGNAENQLDEIDPTIQPSKFCHICTRSYKTVRQAVCRNLVKGTCRKVVCEKCFEDNGWDFELAISEDSGWCCCHCAEKCPASAQCTHYNRANPKVEARRKRQRIERKEMKMRASRSSLLSLGSGSAPRPRTQAQPMLLQKTGALQPMPFAHNAMQLNVPSQMMVYPVQQMQQQDRN